MDLGGLRALALDLNFSAHGVPATVTPSPTHDPIETRGIWMTPLADLQPVGLDLQRADARRVMALRRDQVPQVPRGAAIIAPELPGGPLKAWRVDGMERVEADHYRVLVVPDPEAQLFVEAG